MGDLRSRVIPEEALPDTSLSAPADREYWWEEQVDDWVIALRIGEQHGHAVVTELRIFPNQRTWRSEAGEWDFVMPAPPGGLPASLPRQAKTATRVAEARKALAHLRRPIPGDRLDEAIRAEDLSLIESPLFDAGFINWDTLAELTPSERRPGRKGHPDEYYLRFAVGYVTAIAEGSRSPIQDVAEKTGEKPEYVSQLTKKARDRGLLTRAPRKFQPGGTLTDKARDLLDELQRQSQPTTEDKQ